MIHYHIITQEYLNADALEAVVSLQRPGVAQHHGFVGGQVQEEPAFLVLEQLGHRAVLSRLRVPPPHAVPPPVVRVVEGAHCSEQQEHNQNATPKNKKIETQRQHAADAREKEHKNTEMCVIKESNSNRRKTGDKTSTIFALLP